MRCFLTLFMLSLLAACAPAAPDDRAIQVIAEGDAPAPNEVTGENQPPENTETSPGDIELCDAQDYRALIGTQAADASFTTGTNLRVFGENDIVTQEYLPHRTNIVTNDGGTIRRVYCG